MKITNLLKLLPVLLIGMSSCCHEVDCSIGQLNVIGFINFHPHELDSAIIKKFAIGSTYQTGQTLDSFIIGKYNSISNISSDTANVSIASGTAPFTISPGFKYQIIIPSIPDTATIDSILDVQTQVQACSGTEYTAKACVNPLQLIYQDGVPVGSHTSYQIIYITR